MVRTFEVLDPVDFASGGAYVGYLDSRDVVSATLSARAAQKAIDEASRRVEMLTSRFFEPRYVKVKEDGRGKDYLEFGQPIIGLDSLDVVDVDVVSKSPIELTSFRIYNRHLQGVLDVDDRDYPKIAFITSAGLPVDVEYVFPLGPQSVEVGGLFGYTEPDGSPSGRTPAALRRVVRALMTQVVADPSLSNPFTSSPGRIKSYKTRDQAVTFASAQDGNIGGLTGDRAIDDLLLPFMRTPRMGTA